jgi:hypothetical protein
MPALTSPQIIYGQMHGPSLNRLPCVKPSLRRGPGLTSGSSGIKLHNAGPDSQRLRTVHSSRPDTGCQTLITLSLVSIVNTQHTSRLFCTLKTKERSQLFVASNILGTTSSQEVWLCPCISLHHILLVWAAVLY